jgi:beta-galactosidase
MRQFETNLLKQSVIKKFIPMVLIMFSLAFTSRVCAQHDTIRLNDNWKFLKSDLGSIWEAVRPVVAGEPESVPLWKNVTLPHCFNARDAVDPDKNYYQGPGWYKNQIEIKNPYLNGRTFLHFEGAGQKTEVYVYMTKVGSHIGGYDAWSVDITDAVNTFLQNKSLAESFKGKIPIEIRCDNSRDAEMIPSNMADFDIYGGIYRYLDLVYKPALAINQFYINAAVDPNGKLGQVNLNVQFFNKTSFSNANLKIEILDPNNKVVASKVVEIKSFKSGFQEVYSTTLNNPKLYSPSNPNLYFCKVTLTSKAGIQTSSKHFGFRNFEFIKHGPFILNGTRLLIRGTTRHADQAGVGAAETEAMIRKEMIMIKEMGANFIRLGHYEQSDIVLHLCDSLGLLVWEEIPWNRGGLGNERYKEQARNMLTNMITQHRTHPSVILWGLGNEIDWPGDFPEFSKQKIRDFLTELNTLAHHLDPSRKTVIRRCDFCKDIPDVYSPSMWPGWYRGSYTEYKTVTEKAINSVNYFFHAEWGGDSHAGRNSENPDKVLQKIKTGQGVDERLGDASLTGGQTRVSKDGDWSESYICDLYDWILKEQETIPQLTGSAFWIFKDFPTPLRPDNPIPYVNEKGVVQRDLTKKEVYYVVQSRWSNKPMAHIFGHDWPIRWGNVGEERMVKVYSNCDEAELFLNGQSCGLKKRDSLAFPAQGLWWDVVYQPGENHLKVIAKKGSTIVVDSISQKYQTQKWGAPTQMTLQKISQQGDTATIEVKLFDTNHVMCLNARNWVIFGLTGDGKLIDDQGTTTGSRKIELYNGRAIIRVNLKAGSSIASVKCKDIPTVFCNLP